jgi:hypothetical protein
MNGFSNTGDHFPFRGLSHSPSDRILWALANNGDKMERSRLRVATGMRYALLIPILEDLAREARLKLLLERMAIWYP